ncbi:uncharacterized protein G2W53_030864 [Senna tora]|uniref:Uncharacterized protein n=1 Tax=Senna tora TaxID=362788 RepID=A0A834T7V5_9FABA|nr:uncharacterized protein G2W53_030864 [Senna tora]
MASSRSNNDFLGCTRVEGKGRALA